MDGNSSSNPSHPSSKPHSQQQLTLGRQKDKQPLETRSQPPSLMQEEAGIEEHPLLSLHQSVSGSGNNNKKLNGVSVMKGSIPQEQQSQEPKNLSMNDTIAETKALKMKDATSMRAETGSSKQIPMDSTKSNGMKGEEGKSKRKQKEKTLASMLFKFLATFILLVLWIILMNTVIINSSIDIQQNAPQFVTDLSAGISAAQSSAITNIRERSSNLLSLLSDNGSNSISIEQYEKRLEMGQNLLRKYDDASGSATSCKRTFHAMLEEIGDDDTLDKKEVFVSLVSSLSMGESNADENRLLLKALLCMGEARLALFSSPFGSSDVKRDHLMEAKDSFEAGNILDPTNPSVRNGSGLSYLLLGVMNYDEDTDSSKQLIFQSIQHLKATLGLTNDAESKAGDEVIALRTGATHNLGLAYIALDGLTSSDLAGKSTYFLDWMTSLRSSGASQPLIESWVLSANEGALLLQMGNMEDAITSLESTVGEVCPTDSSLVTSRQKEMCLIVQQNLAVAKAAAYGEEEEPSSVPRQLGGGSKIYDEIARWNADASSELSDEEQIQDEDVISSIGNETETTNASGEENETSPPVEEIIKGDDAASEVDTSIEPTSEAIETMKKEDLADVPSDMKKVKPAMRHALSSLEKAATEGPQRTRLLLALARARSSAGDSSGAVDAALNAINVASSDEESETATLYLESLMDKMAEDGDEEDTVKIIPEEYLSLEKVEKKEPPSFIERRDFALTELQLKLELERLKYKVLEQEMRLGGMRQQNSRQYRDEMRAIDYQQEEDHIVKDSPRRQRSDPIEEIIVKSKTSTKTHTRETVADVIQEEPAPTDIVEESEPENSIENVTVIEAEESGIDSLSDVVAIEDEEVSPDAAVAVEDAEISPGDAVIDDAVASTDAVVTDDSESVQDQVPPEEDGSADSNSTAAIEVAAPYVEPIQLPSLYEPILAQPKPMPPTAKSYMKMADAYLDKGKYALAAKQFKKVIKKAPDHLPAHLGYATAIERDGKSKQINLAALAYANATKVAIVQGERVDPMSKAGAGGIAENILRRAMQLAKSAPSGRLETLRQLSESAHTNSLAAATYYEIGMEIVKQSIDIADNQVDAVKAFNIANEFVVTSNNSDAPSYHIGSMVELGKIALEYENDAARVIDIFSKVKNVHMEDNIHVELLVLVGRAYASLGELETAVTEFTRAISLPQSSATGTAHYELAIALKNSNGDSHEINPHFEKALDMGMDPTPEAIEALGDRNMSLMRALNRQYYKNYDTGGGEKTGGGGIMNGGGVGSQSSSVFAPQAKQKEEASAQAQTLTLLEQGAASYDGQSAMGGVAEGAESSLSNLKVKKQQGSESNLANLKR